MINCPNLHKLKEQKDKVVEMPVTQDITVFLKYLVDKVKQLVNAIEVDQNSNLWYQLAKVCLAYLIVFNRSRVGEVSNILLNTYVDRPNYSELESHELSTLSKI